MNFEFMTIDTPLPLCMPFPRALTGFPVSSTATEVMSTYMYYQSFNILNYGYASAIGVVLMLLCMLSVGISNRVFKTDETV